MDLQRKTIQNLTVALDEKREELAVFYHHFGEKLLGDSLDPTIVGGALASERTDNWRSLMSTREADTQAILDIKAAINRQQELYHFRKELTKNLAEENARYKDQLEEMGRFFYGQYTEKDSEIFGETYEKASVEGKSLIQLEEKQKKFQLELAESGFFGKMFAQFKMAGLASNIRQHKIRVMKILSDGAASLLSNAVFAKRLEEGKFDPDFDGIVSNVTSIGKTIKELEKRAETLEADLSLIYDTLVTFVAAENPLRRIDELRLRVKESDKRLDSLTVLCAREYSDKFLDEDGSSLLGNTGDGHTFSDMGVYAHNLEQIALQRSDISVIRRNIEVLETSLKIESLDKNIVSYERSIGENERKILHLQELTETLRKNIREASEERIRLCEHKDAIEVTLHTFSS